MKSKIARFSTLILLIALLVSILPACQSATPTQAPAANPTQPSAANSTQAPAAAPAIKGGPLEVGVLWDVGSPSYNLVKTIGDSMEKDYPGTKVTYTFNNTAARPAIEARMLAGNPLDVDFIFNGMDPNSFDWVKNGYLLDLTPYLTAPRADGTKWLDDFNPVFQPAMKYQDKYYAVPEEVYIWMLHYNKQLFDKWNLKPPTTWADVLTLCDTINKNGGGVAPIAVTGQVNYYVGMWYDSLVQRIVGTQKVMDYLYGDKDMKLSDDPGFLQAAQEVEKLKTNNCLINGYEGTDFTTTQLYFFQGKAAMILMGSWLMTEMKASIPPDFQLAVAPFPTFPGGAGNQNAIFGIALAWNIPAKTKNPDLAVEYLRRFTSIKEATQRSEVLGSVPPVIGAPAPAAIIGMDTSLKNAQTAEFILYDYGLGSAKFGLQDAWYNPLVDMWAGKLTPQQAMDKIDANVTAVRQQRKTAATATP